MDLPISMVIFHSYVSLPEGMYAHQLKYIHGLQDKIDHDNTTQCLPNNHEIPVAEHPRQDYSVRGREELVGSVWDPQPVARS